MLREEITKLIERSIKILQKDKKLPEFKIPEISLMHPIEKTHGDYATSIALQVGKMAKKDPIETANLIVGAISRLSTKPLFENIEVAKPGFINFYLLQKILIGKLKRVIKEKKRYGSIKVGKGKKVNVEFISANPTGPLTLGNGRGGFSGDVLSNVLKKAGYKVGREYYVNDVGEQVRKLGHSVIGDSEAVYKGDYIIKLRKKIKGNDSEKVGQRAASIILKEMIKPAVKKMGIKFNVWFSEKSLYRNKEVDKTLNWLKRQQLTYEKDGALWFKSTQFGDDKDRVLIKADGEKTYFASDIAYLKNKFKRGFKRLIFFLGADHYGYIGRMKAAVKALGYEKEQADFIIMQLVRLFEGERKVRMSKRTGGYVTLEELINEVGLDVARFFFLTRSSGSHLNFDLDLAKERSEKNPVYYVQYAHARIASILRKSKVKRHRTTINLNLLNHSSELTLIKQLIRFPEVIEDTAKDYQIQRIPQYAVDLATAFHRFYRDCQVISQDNELRQDRLVLVLTTKTVLKNTLDLMGISAPDRM